MRFNYGLVTFPDPTLYQSTLKPNFEMRNIKRSLVGKLDTSHQENERCVMYNPARFGHCLLVSRRYCKSYTDCAISLMYNAISVGFGVADLGPSSGSVVANFVGAINATTLRCDVTFLGSQIDTFWSVANFRGVVSRQGLILLSQNLFLTGGMFLNELTVANWTSEVDKVIVFCGSGSQPTQANVTLRLYRKFERRS